VLNGVLLVLVLVYDQIPLQPGPPAHFVGREIGLAGVGVVFFYCGLIGLGRRIYGGRSRGVSVAAWVVLPLAYLCLVWNTRAVLASLSWLHEFQATGIPAWAYLLLPYLIGYLLGSLMLVFVDALLIAACVGLLWQSAHYVHWVNGGMPAPSAPGRVSFPVSITFGSWLWILAGLCSAGLVGQTNWATSDTFWIRWDTLAKCIATSELASVPLLTVFLLGLLVLNGRLPSLVPVALVLLFVSFVGLLREAFLLGLPYGAPDVLGLPSGDVREGKWLLVGLLLTTGMGAVGGFACLFDGDAYKTWLRQGRGLRV
jgi:hypothetical protein